MPQNTRITVAHGDGIGPEIMGATLRVLEAADARLSYDTIEIGKKVYESGNTAGIPDAAWDTLRENRIFLKAPITTPQGGGYKSLNVTIRKTLSLYANVRRSVSYHPMVKTHHPKMDVVIVRENEEDLYAGIEHRQTEEVLQCLKLISKPGSRRLIRYAFEYAQRHGRKSVTCMVKDNIMKLTDGMFHKIFGQVGREYPNIAKRVVIVDIGAARLAQRPEDFDVVVMPNLYGDILSDIAAEITGSVGLGGSANIGEYCSMFEAIHGSAPDIAGQGIANPSGLLLASVMMLAHLGQGDVAARIHNAWLRTLEDGVHTGDIFRHETSSVRVGTDGFTDAVIARLGEYPRKLDVVTYPVFESPLRKPVERRMPPPPRKEKKLVGVDVFLDWRGPDPDTLGSKLAECGTDALQLVMITNRGVKVWPGGVPETFCTDHWRCRFQPPGAIEGTDPDATISHGDVLALLQRVHEAGFDFIKTEHLCTFNGIKGYSLGQGQ